MKKLFLAAIAVFGFVSVQAQDVKFGAKGGLNLANITGSDAGGSNMKAGFHVGAFVEIPIADKLIIQPEIHYSNQGTQQDGAFEGISFDAKFQLNYINVPVMFKYAITEKFSIEGGPYVGFLTSAKIEVDVAGFGSNSEDVKELFKSTDFGLGIGMNYDFSDVIFANVRYQAGLTQIGDSGEGDDIKNSVIQIGLGFRF